MMIDNLKSVLLILLGLYVATGANAVPHLSTSHNALAQHVSLYTAQLHAFRRVPRSPLAEDQAKKLLVKTLTKDGFYTGRIKWECIDVTAVHTTASKSVHVFSLWEKHGASCLGKARVLNEFVVRKTGKIELHYKSDLIAYTKKTKQLFYTKLTADQAYQKLSKLLKKDWDFGGSSDKCRQLVREPSVRDYKYKLKELSGKLCAKRQTKYPYKYLVTKTGAIKLLNVGTGQYEPYKNNYDNLFISEPPGVRKCSPIDETSKIAGFAKFRTRLLKAVKDKDSKYYLSVLDKKFSTNFDVEYKLPVKSWYIHKPDSVLWKDLAKIGRLGLKVENKNTVSFPNIVCPEKSKIIDDILDSLIVTGTNVRIRSAPSVKAKIVGVLNWELVLAIVGRDYDDKNKQSSMKWNKINAGKGKKGYVASHLLEKMVVGRTSIKFEYKDGKWWITEYSFLSL